MLYFIDVKLCEIYIILSDIKVTRVSLDWLTSITIHQYPWWLSLTATLHDTSYSKAHNSNLTPLFLISSQMPHSHEITISHSTQNISLSPYMYPTLTHNIFKYINSQEQKHSSPLSILLFNDPLSSLSLTLQLDYISILCRFLITHLREV
jgi:hypothetical protein